LANQALDLQRHQGISAMHQEIALEKRARPTRVRCKRVANESPTPAAQHQLNLIFAAGAESVSVGKLDLVKRVQDSCETADQ
jgi:hypothetical protein